MLLSTSMLRILCFSVIFQGDWLSPPGLFPVVSILKVSTCTTRGSFARCLGFFKNVQNFVTILSDCVGAPNKNCFSCKVNGWRNNCVHDNNAFWLNSTTVGYLRKKSIYNTCFWFFRVKASKRPISIAITGI